MSVIVLNGARPRPGCPGRRCESFETAAAIDPVDCFATHGHADSTGGSRAIDSRGQMAAASSLLVEPSAGARRRALFLDARQRKSRARHSLINRWEFTSAEAQCGENLTVPFFDLAVGLESRGRRVISGAGFMFARRATFDAFGVIFLFCVFSL